MKILLITGPSGAGKDSLLRLAAHHFRKDSRLCLVKRYITRQPDSNEQNYFVDHAAFTLLCKNNFFISHWNAHGNLYGIPRTGLPDKNENTLAIISISRQNVGDFERCFERVTTLGIKVDPDILRNRLRARGREDDKSIEKRLQRTAPPIKARRMLHFDNSEELACSGKQFLDLLDSLAEE